MLSQNYPNLEYLVIDAGSTDETIDILKSYEGKIRYVVEKDDGQSDAINKGIRMSSGEIIAFLNSDDYYFPDILSLVAAEFADPHCLWLTGYYRIIDEFERTIHPGVNFYKKILSQFSTYTLLKITNYIAQPSTFWRRELIESVGFFDVNLRYTMDYDMWLRFFKYSRPRIIRRPLSNFRVHFQSKGGREYQAQFQEELNVMKRYTSNKAITTLHRFSNYWITSIYKIIKK